MKEKKVIIIGAGISGLTTALELSKIENIKVDIYELEEDIGGLARTYNYNGNKIDIGPHRFFSKSDNIVDYWKNLEPHLLIKDRLTRIYFESKFFDYPIKLSIKLFQNLGFLRTLKIVFSYFKSFLFPKKDERNLEDFFINRFGKELYLLFFKYYTEKVWGIDCKDISADWGKQRIKRLSAISFLLYGLKSKWKLTDKNDKNCPESIIDFFYYPENGAQSILNNMAREIKENGGVIHLNKQIVSLELKNNNCQKVIIKDLKTNETFCDYADYYVSSMPIKDLVECMNNVPNNIREIANNLEYRDLIVIGLLFKTFKDKDIKDNWIYLQDRNMKAGRLEIYNNFSSKMLNDKDTIWLGLEYFCNENDYLWNKSDEKLIELGVEELSRASLFNPNDFIDGTVFKIKKAYPGYFGSYDRLCEIKGFTNQIKNLLLIGRNGLHKYNNMDHSIICGLMAAEAIIEEKNDQDKIWNINVEEAYQESK